jgi:TRAP-type uncharacterized transport system fused permease subunit
MEVHMFMLFYSCMSAITPPVAVAAFAAGSIAGASPFRIAPYACKLAVGGFVLPFYFLFNNGMLMQGGALHIVSDTAIGAVLVLTASLVLHGFVRQRRIPVALRAVFIAAAVAMALPHPAIQYSAAAAALALFLVLLRAARADAPRPAATASR